MQKKGPSFDEPFLFRAGKEIRTLDPNLGKVMLYQLSYSRIRADNYKNGLVFCKGEWGKFLECDKADLGNPSPSGRLSKVLQIIPICGQMNAR